MRLAAAVVVLLLSSGCAHQMMAADMAALNKPPPEPEEGKISLTVVSGDHRQWNVMVGGQAVCATPCSGNLDLGESFAVESTASNEGIFIPALPAEVIAARRGVVIAEGEHEGKQVNGIVWTSLGGMALVTAITLSAVGCSDLEDRRGMCNAGLITGGVGLPLTAFGIYLLVDSGPRVQIYPAKPRSAASAPQVLLTPVGVAGTF